MQCTFEFEMWRGEERWIIAPFGIPGVTEGEDVEDACESAADLLRETMIDLLIRGRELPKPSFGNESKHDGIKVVVSVEVSLSDMEKVSATEAARLLGVSRSRVTAMIESGRLDGWKEGRNTWVTRASVDARLENPRSAGRPKKIAVA